MEQADYRQAEEEMAETLFIKTIYIASDSNHLGSCAHPWASFGFQEGGALILSGRATKSTWNMGHANKRRKEGLLTEGVEKHFLVKTGSLTVSATLIEKEAWLRGLEKIKNSRRRSKDQDELNFKHIQTVVSEIISSVDALKATGNGLKER